MEERKLTFGEHIEELRRTVLYSILAIFIAFFACWFFKDAIMHFLAGPHQRIMRVMGLPEDLKLLNYTEGFFTYLKVCFVAAAFVSSPVVVYLIWRFVSEGLYPSERRYVHYFAPASLGLFIAGMLFGFYVLIPFGLRFLLAIGGDIASPLIRLSDYVSLLIVLTLVLGLVFELPLIMLFLVKVGIMTPEQYREQWRYAYFAMVVLAAMITPTGDPVNLTLVSVPMIGLYEVGILLCRPSLRHLLTLVGVTAFVVGGSVGVYQYVSRKPSVLGVVASGRGQTLGASSRPLAGRDSVFAGMALKTEFAQRLKVDLGNASELRINSDSELRVESADRIFLEHGEVLVSIAQGGAAFSVATPDGVIEIREGSANVQAGPDGTRVIAVKAEQTVVVNGVKRPVAEGHCLAVKQGGDPIDVKKATRWAEFP